MQKIRRYAPIKINVKEVRFILLIKRYRFKISNDLIVYCQLIYINDKEKGKKKENWKRYSHDYMRWEVCKKKKLL